MSFNEPIQVLYDHQIFELQRYGGVSRYFFEIISRFIKERRLNPSIAVSISSNNFLNQIDPKFVKPGVIDPYRITRPTQPDPYSDLLLKFKKNFNNLLDNRKINLISEKNTKNTIQILQNGNYDIFHPTYFNPYFIPFLNKKPFIITIYDLIHEKFPELYPLRDQTIHNRKMILHRADKIISISENTKKDILNFYDIDPEKIEVIYLGNEHISRNFTPNNISTNNFPHKFFLYVGDRTSYKNFYFLIEAISPILRTNPYHLLCYGGGTLSDSELFFIEKLGIKNKVIHMSGEDDTLRLCYQKAMALIYPSLYEGFGIPIIEALHEKCPVIASNIPSSVEIAGDAAIFFDPKNPRSLQEAILKIADDELYRMNIIKRGLERSKKFSWDITAEKTEKVYMSLIES